MNTPTQPNIPQLDADFKTRNLFAIDTKAQFKIISMFPQGSDYEIAYYDSAVKDTPTLKTICKARFKGKKQIFCEDNL